jgi:hypothetical protein
MTQYYFGKRNLLQACNITNKEDVSCLIDGLMDHTLKNGAKAGHYGTPEQLYAKYLYIKQYSNQSELKEYNFGVWLPLSTQNSRMLQI